MNPSSFIEQNLSLNTSGAPGSFVEQSPDLSASTAPSSGASTGFFQSSLQSMAAPFLQFARLPAGLITEGVGKLTGNEDLAEKGAAAASSQPYDFGYFGTVDAPGYDNNGKPLSFGNATAQATGAGLQIAPWFVGAGEADAAANAARQGFMKTVLKGVGAGAGVGGAQGAGSNLETQAETGGPINFGDVAQSGAVGAGGGAVSGGVLAGAGALGSEILNSLADHTPGTRLQNQADSLKSLTNAIRDSKTNPVETITNMINTSKEPLLAVKDGKVDTSLLEDAIGGMKREVNKQATAIVENMPGTVNLGELQSQIEQAIKGNATLRGSGGVTRALSKLEDMFSDYVKSYGSAPLEGEAAPTAKDVNVPYKVINEIRTSMNKYFDKDTVDLERTIGNVARKYLYDSNSGSPALKKLMDQWGALDDAENFAQKLRGTAIKGGRLGKYLADMVGAGVGSAAAAPLGPLGVGAGAVVGGAATDKVMDRLQQGFFKPSVLAGPASAISRFTGSPPVQAGSSVGRQMLIRSAANGLTGNQ